MRQAWGLLQQILGTELNLRALFYAKVSQHCQLYRGICVTFVRALSLADLYTFIQLGLKVQAGASFQPQTYTHFYRNMEDIF